MVFADNDRPGVMLASAARTYLNHYGVAVGRNVGIYTANDSAYAAAIDLKKAGVNVAAIVDIRDNPAGPAIDEARALGIEINQGCAVTGVGGKLRVSSMTIQPKNGGTARTIPIDALLMSAGWTPSVHLFSQSRGKVAFDDCTSVSCLAYTHRTAPRRRLQRHRRARSDRCGGLRRGRAGGETGWRQGWQERESEGRDHGKLVWRHAGFGARGRGPASTVKAFVDFQNDVTAKDIRLAVREGMRSIEHVKRFTTTGMATDQGKTSNMHGLAIAAETLGNDIPQVGLTTFRAPYTPVTFGVHRKPRARSAVRSDAKDGDSLLGRSPWRCVRRCRAVETRLVLPATRRGHACRGQP